MCPNCILNQVGISPGLYVAFGVCFLFFVVGIAAMWWAFRNGEFEDMESVKYDMMTDEPTATHGQTQLSS
ncbi:MAG: cbb3-type cytochrome oxidase assembly protein [Candidatus Obscuribacterales bacterium]|nr:cbb3-type cytochrome oxidase assembly protein [Candidatus Obscuribacterales bacterium]